ncbi:MAG: hypothetical protein HY584_06370 [Candidatus Omnitrophica bacterium]|nr:hypothetical protein [Candidatus Omnitrophota bacterium]
MKKILIPLIAASLIFWAEILWAEVARDGNSIVGTPREKPVSSEVINGGERLSLAEQQAVLSTTTVTVSSIESNSTSGTDPFIEAKRTSQLTQDLKPTSEGSSSRILKPEEPRQIQPEPVRPLDEPLEPRRQVEPTQPEQGRKGGTPLVTPSKESDRETFGFVRDEDSQNLETELKSSLEEIFDSMKKGKRMSWKQDEPDEGKTPRFEDRFDYELDKEILELSTKLNAILSEGKEEDKVLILSAIDFTGTLRLIDRLLHPPERLHPWLKWLLYLKQVTPEMLQYYQAALEQRDRIYMVAAGSNGKFKIRYQGRIMDAPIYLWPDQAEGRYELVMVRDRIPTPGSESRTVPVAAVAPPTS